HVVADVEVHDRARDCEARVRTPGHAPAIRDHSRGRQASRSGDSREDTVLQSQTQNSNAGCMNDHLKTIIEQYDPNLALDYASTIPSSWYIDKDFYNHE